jgi:hypothetical protein
MYVASAFVSVFASNVTIAAAVAGAGAGTGATVAAQRQLFGVALGIACAFSEFWPRTLASFTCVVITRFNFPFYVLRRFCTAGG